jgi:hypothetical protein
VKESKTKKAVSPTFYFKKESKINKIIMGNSFFIFSNTKQKGCSINLTKCKQQPFFISILLPDIFQSAVKSII